MDFFLCCESASAYIIYYTTGQVKKGISLSKGIRKCCKIKRPRLRSALTGESPKEVLGEAAAIERQ
jgi:hypothetical protein